MFILARLVDSYKPASGARKVILNAVAICSSAFFVPFLCYFVKDLPCEASFVEIDLKGGYGDDDVMMDGQEPL
jgi:hypothetical protein